MFLFVWVGQKWESHCVIYRDFNHWLSILVRLLFFFAICGDAGLQVQALSRSPLFEGAAASNLVLLATNVQAGTCKDVNGVFGRAVAEPTHVSLFDALTNGQHVLHFVLAKKTRPKV